MSCRALSLIALIVVAAVNSALAEDGGTDQPAESQPSATARTPVDPKGSVGGIITLSAARKDDVKRGDALFVVARRADGPPGPASMMAAQKLTVGNFPMKFTLSSRDAMIPGTPFEGLVSITVRVDKDGDAMTRRKGDVFGLANDIKVGTQDVVIHLDALQTEDKTLGAPVTAAPSQGSTGLPPGNRSDR